MLFLQMASVARVRSEMVHAAHAFFQANGFFHVNTPVITATAAGDRSKMFRVMRVKSKSDNRAITPEVVRASIKAKTKQIEVLKRSESNKEALQAAELDLQRANDLATQLEQQGNADFSDYFFQHPVYLSPDHTLHLETYACALSSVYTFSPAFQAENFEPHRHLAEKWTIDTELAFAELEVYRLSGFVFKHNNIVHTLMSPFVSGCNLLRQGLSDAAFIQSV